MSEPKNNAAMVILAQLDRGRVMHQFSEELQKVLEGVENTQKAGSIQLNLEIKPVAESEGQVTVTGRIKAVIPKPCARATLFFVTDDHQLTRQNPSQNEFWSPEQVDGQEESRVAQ